METSPSPSNDHYQICQIVIGILAIVQLFDYSPLPSSPVGWKNRKPLSVIVESFSMSVCLLFFRPDVGDSTFPVSFQYFSVSPRFEY